MKKISYILGMLAAGGAMGAAANAAATTVTLNLPLSSDASVTTITLAGAIDPQYEYGSFANIPGATGNSALDSGIVSYLYNFSAPGHNLSSIRQIASSTTKNDIGLVVGESQGAAPLTFQQWLACGSSCVKSNYGFPVAGIVSGPDASPTGGNEYFYLLFTNTANPASNDDIFFGYATIGSPSDARPPPHGVTGGGVLGGADPTELVSITYNAVPEPESWALMLAGAGLVGGALRANRRRRAAVAA